MSQPITKAHIKLSMSYAGILSYCTLLVRLVEDLAINHRFDSTDNLTMITSVTAIVVAAVTLLGGQIIGTQDAPESAPSAAAPDQATPGVALPLPLPGSFTTLAPVTIALTPAGPDALTATAAPATAVATTAPAVPPVPVAVAPVAPSVP